MNEPRILSPETARVVLMSDVAEYVKPPLIRDLAYTAAVLGEQRDAALALHRPSTDHRAGSDPYCVGCWEAGGEDGAPTYPCATARALGVQS